MPVRIIPIHNLPTCTLNFESIEGILELVDNQFKAVSCYATDDKWEVFDEAAKSFLELISKREKLDSFRVIGSNPTMSDSNKEIQIVFSETEAKVSLKAPPEDEKWFEHFLIDLNKLILPPSYSQRFSYSGGAKNVKPEPSAGIIGAFLQLIGISSAEPYCRIILYQKPPDPFWENIKANLASNIIWAVIVFIFGVLITLITTGQIKMP